MDYEKAYKDALERARNIRFGNPNSATANVVCEEIFPELAKSEDDRIRKEIIEYLEERQIIEKLSDTKVKKNCLAFQAKQGELKPTWSEEDEGVLYLTISLLDKFKEEAYTNDCEDCINWLKSIKPQPRFKVGDWVVFNNDHDSIYQVEKIENYEYTLRHILGGSMPLSFSHGNMIRTWTIQDVKDGDVLVYKGEIFMIKSYVLWNKIVYHCCYDGKNLHKHSVYYSLGREDFDKVHPATKEQCDLLFQKMHEAHTVIESQNRK